MEDTQATPKAKGKFYITNEVLLPEVKRSKELGYITNELGKMFMLIVDRFSRHPSFSGYSFKEDMKSFALTNLCANGLKFDSDKYKNPFTYYTTAIYHSFLQYLAEEKKQRNIRDTMLIDLGSNPSSTFMNNAHDDYVENHGAGNSDDIQYHDEREVNPHEDEGASKVTGTKKKNRNYGLGGKKKPVKVVEPVVEEVVTAEVPVEEIVVSEDKIEVVDNCSGIFADE